MSEVTTEVKRENGRIVVVRSQDTSAYLERNKRERAAFQKPRNENLRLVADIPMIVVEQWMKQGVNIFDPNDNKKVQALLNSNEYQYLRTSPGKIAVK